MEEFQLLVLNNMSDGGVVGPLFQRVNIDLQRANSFLQVRRPFFYARAVRATSSNKGSVFYDVLEERAFGEQDNGSGGTRFFGDGDPASPHIPEVVVVCPRRVIAF